MAEETLVRHPYFIYPSGLNFTPLEYSLLEFVALFFKIRAEDIGHPGRDIRHAYDSLVLMPFPNGRIGLEAAVRADLFTAHGHPVFVIVNSDDAVITRSALRQFENNFRSGLFTIRLITEDEKRRIASCDEFLVTPFN